MQWCAMQRRIEPQGSNCSAFTDWPMMEATKLKVLWVVDQTTHPLSWKSCVSTGIQDRQVPLLRNRLNWLLH